MEILTPGYRTLTPTTGYTMPVNAELLPECIARGQRPRNFRMLEGIGGHYAGNRGYQNGYTCLVSLNMRAPSARAYARGERVTLTPAAIIGVAWYMETTSGDLARMKNRPGMRRNATWLHTTRKSAREAGRLFVSQHDSASYDVGKLPDGCWLLSASWVVF